MGTKMFIYLSFVVCVFIIFVTLIKHLKSRASDIRREHNELVMWYLNTRDEYLDACYEEIFSVLALDRKATRVNERKVKAMQKERNAVYRRIRFLKFELSLIRLWEWKCWEISLTLFMYYNEDMKNIKYIFDLTC